MQAVDKIGPLEYILNTPSHHRVHHGVNRYCIDKNYAGVFIVWDRLFGMRLCLFVILSLFDLLSVTLLSAQTNILYFSD